MGNIEVFECIFTGLPAKPIINHDDIIEYIIKIGEKNHLIKLYHGSTDWVKSDIFFKRNRHIFQGLLFNNNWFSNEKEIITIESLKELLETSSFPKSPQEKQDLLFLNFFNLQEEDGELVIIKSDYYELILWKKLYFKSLYEMNFYAKTLDDIGVINGYFNTTNSRRYKLLERYNITFKGLNYRIKLIESGKNSNKCFIAMAFDDKTIGIRNAIKSALVRTGFNPVLVDEEHIDSDQTINDRIIADLKQCNFCIADFTLHRNGVYFESGFALGQGKRVIYTCDKKEFEKAHFDIKPLQHIIYETPKELENKLVDKIEAWII